MYNVCLVCLKVKLIVSNYHIFSESASLHGPTSQYQNDEILSVSDTQHAHSDILGHRSKGDNSLPVSGGQMSNGQSGNSGQISGQQSCTITGDLASTISTIAKNGSQLLEVQLLNFSVKHF